MFTQNPLENCIAHRTMYDHSNDPWFTMFISIILACLLIYSEAWPLSQYNACQLSSAVHLGFVRLGAVHLWVFSCSFHTFKRHPLTDWKTLIYDSRFANIIQNPTLIIIIFLKRCEEFSFHIDIVLSYYSMFTIIYILYRLRLLQYAVTKWFLLFRFQFFRLLFSSVVLFLTYICVFGKTINCQNLMAIFVFWL